MIAHALLLITGIMNPFTSKIGEVSFFVVRFAMGLGHNAFFMSFYMLGNGFYL